MEKEKKRDYAISYVRFTAMIMIIMCHFFQYYQHELALWFNVGVEIFFIISGYLYGSKNITEPIDFIFNQFLKILVPYFAFLFPISVIYTIFVQADFSLISFVRAFFCVGTIDGFGHLWFIGYILLCYFFTPYLHLLYKKVEKYSLYKTIIVYILILFCIVVLGYLTESYFQPNRICAYVLGFMLSTLSLKCKKYQFKIIKYFFICLAFILNGIRVYIKYYVELPKGTIYYKLFSFAEPYVHILLGLGLFFVLYFVFSRFGACSIVAFSDRYSFSIYIVHLTFILSPFSTMALTSNIMINWVITIMLILLFGVAFHHFTTGYVEKIFLRRKSK